LLLETIQKRKKIFFRQDQTIDIWIVFSLIPILPVLMVISGHNLDLQTGNIDLVRDGQNLKNISLKIKNKISLSTLVFFSRMPYIFLNVGCILAGQGVKNLSGCLLILERPLKRPLIA
jgi:hypothetical protein